MPVFNWIPKDHLEFTDVVKQGRLSLNPMHEHLKWLSDQGLRRRLFESRDRFDKRVLSRMVADEKFFNEAFHTKGIDLVLLDPA